MAGASRRVALADNWDEALERSGFWDLLHVPRGKSPPRVLVLLNLGGSRQADPQLVQPRAVEALIDLIHDRLGTTPVLAASADETRLWAGNRDVHALADLLGYRFVTDRGLDYDLVDLGDNLVEAPFPAGTALHGSTLSADWLAADIRLNLARLRPDPAEGFAAGLLDLQGCLPLTDKALHYRHRRDAGTVISEILRYCPPHHTLIDAVRDESNGGRDHDSEDNPDDDPESAGAGQCRFAVAGGSALLAEFAAALKAGLDPYCSPLVEAVAASNPLPPDFEIEGSLEPIEVLVARRPVAQMSAQRRRFSEAGDRLLETWLKPLDPEIFPAARPIDARAADLAAELGAETGGEDSSPTGNALVTAVNLAVGAGGQAARAWNTLFDKDKLVQRIVSLDIDPHAIPSAEYDAVVGELEALLPVAAAAPERAPGLRWRRFEKAVLFQYTHSLAIPFDHFVERVDVSRTIEFMNDYLGGVMVVIVRDDAGRPIRQAERNLYLPQPNYLVLYGGEPIDVTKIERVRYESDAHRLYWKTIRSSNGSASADDGVAFFEREEGGTRITIAGKQLFTLPPAMRLFDLSLLPDYEATLTTQAYQRFFERTIANFEALVEGREIRLGRDPDEETPHPSIALEEWAASLAERAAPLLARLKSEDVRHSQPDENGFVHVVPKR
ncbi:MAG: DUF362 domain-containing protein [Candidatus Wenzhouxiangella sp. M2_3B_020]